MLVVLPRALSPSSPVWTPTCTDIYLIGLRMNMSRRHEPVHCSDLEEAQCLLADCMANVNEK
jgi:hypothetical protein